MKLVFSSPNSTGVGLLQGQLEVAAIPSEWRNQAAAQVMIGAPFDPELWVEDADFPAALALVSAWRTAANAEG